MEKLLYLSLWWSLISTGFLCITAYFMSCLLSYVSYNQPPSNFSLCLVKTLCQTFLSHNFFFLSHIVSSWLLKNLLVATPILAMSEWRKKTLKRENWIWMSSLQKWNVDTFLVKGQITSQVCVGCLAKNHYTKVK